MGDFVTVFPLPTSYRWGKVIGRIVHAVADSLDDPDPYPNMRPAVGTATFTPADTTRKVTDIDYPAIVMHERVVSTINTDGYLTDAEGRHGIWLIEGVWLVSFTVVDGTIPSLEILITPNHTDEHPLDIVSAVPYVPPTGTVVQTLVVPAGGIEGQALGPGPTGDLEWHSVVRTINGLVPDVDGDISVAGVGGITPWETITNKPETFPPAPHEHSLDHITGLSEEISRAITAATSNGGSIHIGEGPPPDLIVGAKVPDVYIDTTNGVLYLLQTG